MAQLHDNYMFSCLTLITVNRPLILINYMNNYMAQLHDNYMFTSQHQLPLIQPLIIMFFPFTILLHSFIISVEASDIKSAGTHGPGMHRGMLHHIVR